METRKWAEASLVVLIRDILEMNILIPKLVFDYSTTPDIFGGYYMYQNPSGTIITLNMNSIEALRVEDDIKTVITYGFIHEIMHMFQPINSKYHLDSSYYSMIEDTADHEAIRLMRAEKDLIESRLHFKINNDFLYGIERQLKNIDTIEFEDCNYLCKTLIGAICGRLNINFDYLYNFIISNDPDYMRIDFPDGRVYYLEEYDYDISSGSLDAIINLIYLTDFKLVRPLIENNGYAKLLVLKLY